jgi:BMFP domain-containing protein YqiC
MKTPNIDLSHSLDLLTAARDQVRLSLHLLSLDTRQKWDELEGKILSLENKLGQEAETVSDATASAAIDLTGSVKQFVDSHVRRIEH